MLWVDLETTGLDPAKDTILEIACFFTDDLLQRIGAPFEAVVRPRVLDIASFDRAVWKMHSTSGLLDDVLGLGRSPGEVKSRFWKWYNLSCEQVPELQKSLGRKPIAGSSVHFDVSFLRPFLDEFSWDRQFSHHMIDATCLKELTRRWKPKMELDDKRDTHRAMADLEDSLALLRAHRHLWA